MLVVFSELSRNALLFSAEKRDESGVEGEHRVTSQKTAAKETVQDIQTLIKHWLPWLLKQFLFQ